MSRSGGQSEARDPQCLSPQASLVRLRAIFNLSGTLGISNCYTLSIISRAPPFSSFLARHVPSGRGSIVVIVTSLCHEFEPSVFGKQAVWRRPMHVKLVEAQCPSVGVVIRRERSDSSGVALVT
ncbi:hypothetical protein TNCV_432711 [Trichonephila clavipes]|nr:hypothetical protein TNCV_432711 [Trichonephila clavipes]